MSNTETIRNHAAFIWSVADLLRGDYKQSEYGKVILPMVPPMSLRPYSPI
jgi:type I restriction enzyme M protein